MLTQTKVLLFIKKEENKTYFVDVAVLENKYIGLKSLIF